MDRGAVLFGLESDQSETLPAARPFNADDRHGAGRGRHRGSVAPRASNIATRFLTNYHYKRTRLDDDLSSQIFDHYLELLDPNRIYFLASDVQSFERYRSGMDDALRHSDLMSAYEIFNVYVDRVRQRVEYARNRVQKPFDFTIDEYYRYDREGEPWSRDTAELDELWRKRVKNDYLRLKLTDKEEDAIVETLTERYTNLERRSNELDNEDAFQFFTLIFRIIFNDNA